jgi:DNA-binding NtrC family response regulator
MAGMRRTASGGPPVVPPPAAPAAKGATAPVPSRVFERMRQFPAIGDLSARLHFAPDEGHIWLDDQRMMLLHGKAFSALRQELIDSLGVERAKGILLRFGYASGTQDAHLARKIRSDGDLYDMFAVGPQLHALLGVVKVDPVQLEMDIERGQFYGEFIWRGSVEGDAQLGIYGVGAGPACWTQLGYASGYSSVFMGRPILYREIQCRSMGDPVCRIVGKPADEWEDDPRDSRYLHPDELRRSGAPKPRAFSPLTAAVGHVVGASAGFLSVCHKIQQVANASTTVLFTGETGVGKERFARMLHETSARSKGPFVALNCAAIPDSLLEADLFGVERGAFTGATESRPGKFERANGGTLFLDEVGTLGLAAQAKLLRALQEREVERVGGAGTRPIDVRLIAATNADLEADVAAGRFRADLYYRLSVFPLLIPPLRERREDIPPLLHHFVARFSELHARQVRGFTPRALEALLDYAFPGNIRELENVIERAVLLASEGEAIDVGHLFGGQRGAITGRSLGLDRRGQLAAPPPAAGDGLDALVGQALDAQVPVAEFEARLLRAAVERAAGNIALAAKLLGITRPQLAYRLKKLESGEE